MNPTLTLTRELYRSDGIFSTARDAVGVAIMETLEHAYPNSGVFLPKIPAGTYRCVRGMHRLEGSKGLTDPFDTFEVMGVKGHSGLLFHWGNYNEDSKGCILTGKDRVISPKGVGMVTASRATFARFMQLQAGLDEFTLKVVA